MAGLKRTYQWQDSRSVKSKSVSTEVAKLKRRYNITKPKLKVYQNTVDIALLSQNTLSYLEFGNNIIQGHESYQRNGDEIKIMKVVLTGSFWGDTAGAMNDCLLVLPKDNSTTVMGHFTNKIGAQYRESAGKTLMNIGTQRRTIVPSNQKFVYKWKNGLMMEWEDGNAVPKKNPLRLVWVNNTGTNLSGIEIGYTVYYYDV